MRASQSDTRAASQAFERLHLLACYSDVYKQGRALASAVLVGIYVTVSCYGCCQMTCIHEVLDLCRDFMPARVYSDNAMLAFVRWYALLLL